MDAYELHESRFVQWATIWSAAEAHNVASTAVPEGKVHTLIGAGYQPSGTETQNVQFQIYRPGLLIPVTQVVSFAFTAGSDLWLALLTEGMELKLYPGESLMIKRDGHAAGTTMGLRLRYIESDLPFYSYDEPLKKVVNQSLKRGTTYRSSGGISEVSGGAARPAPPERGGRGNPQPI